MPVNTLSGLVDDAQANDYNGFNFPAITYRNRFIFRWGDWGMGALITYTVPVCLIDIMEMPAAPAWKDKVEEATKLGAA